MAERARRHAVAGCLACVAGFVLVLVLAYWVGPAERLDRTVLDAVSAPTGTLVNEISYVGFAVVNFEPTWVLAGAVAVAIALAQRRREDALFAALLIAGTGALVLALKALLANPRYHPVHVGEAHPGRHAFPSGHAAGSLAMSLALLAVVPSSWRRPTAVAGLLFTIYISAGVLLLNYHFPGDVPAGWLVAAGWWFFLLAVLPSSEPGPCPPRRLGSRPGLSRRAPYAGRTPG